jgi:hypothetical protein
MLPTLMPAGQQQDEQSIIGQKMNIGQTQVKDASSKDMSASMPASVVTRVLQEWQSVHCLGRDAVPL